MPEIEFVDLDDGSGWEEEFDSGPRRQWSPRTKRAAGAAVLAVGAAVLVAALHGGGHGVPNPDDSSATTDLAQPVPSVSPTVDLVLPALPTDRYTESISLPDCVVVRATSCRFDMRVPADVVRAIKAQFGAVSFLRVVTLVGTGRSAAVRSRTVAGQAGQVNVQIDIRPATARDRAGSGTSYVGAFATVYATELRNGVAVTVSVSGVQTQTPSIVSVTALAADRRLLTAH